MLSFYSFGLAGGRWLPADVLRNVLGFMPLGIVFCWRRRSAFLWLALAAGFSLSLSLELLQSVIPGRSSSMVDLLSNSVGALAGGLLTRFWPAR
jgi:glycopeptide antibiotics resistance protein